MKIKKIYPLSFAKLTGFIFAFLGFFLGFLITALTIVAALTGGKPEGIWGYIAVITLPFFYGILGFMMAAVQAWVYNFFAKKIGPVEIDIE